MFGVCVTIYKQMFSVTPLCFPNSDFFHILYD